MTRDLPRSPGTPPSIGSSSRDHRPSSDSKEDAAPSSPASSKGIFSGQPDSDDLIVSEVADQWLHVQWSVSSKTHARAESSMGRDSHRSQRVLRLHRIDQGESRPPSKELQLQIDVPPDASEWFIRIPAPFPTWLVEYGVTFGKGKFFSMLHSSPVSIAPARPAQHRANTLLVTPSFVEAADAANPTPLTVQGTFVLQGITRHRARVLIDDRDVPVDPQTGKFEWQLPVSNGRVVIPIRVTDVNQVRRALLALETNFHLLDPEPSQED